MGEKIAQEPAEVEFERFAELWDLAKPDLMSEEDRTSFNERRVTLVTKIMDGRITIDDEGALTFTPRFTQIESIEALVFNVPGGNAYGNWDKFKERQSVAKLNSFMGSMTGQPPAIFAKFDTRDLKICHAITTLFLAS